MAGAGMITDKKTIQTCSLAGLPTLKGREVELLKIRTAMIVNIGEADAAVTDADFWRTALLGLQLTKATCDAAFGILGALSEGQLKAISAAYSGATPMADTLGKTLAGQKTGSGDWLKASGASANAAVKVSGIGKDMKSLVELQKIKSDIIIDATRSDYPKIKKDMLAYGEKLTKMSAEAMKNKTFGKVYDVTKQIYLTANAYVDAYKEYKAGDIKKAMDGAKKMFRNYQIAAERHLLVLQKEISDCEAQLLKEGKLTKDPFKIDPMDRLRQFEPSFPTIRAAPAGRP